ncbi:MAG: hypothetical protein HW403_1423 [Dehalococcoidia bacterium]|nr:hypothetical protein [Dehalococcoidia bacterium]
MGYYMMGPPPPGSRWRKFIPKRILAILDEIQEISGVVGAVFSVLLPIFGFFLVFAFICGASLWLVSLVSGG